MTIKTDVDLKAAFARAQHGKEEPKEVPEEIRQHAPHPELRPRGSWKARADTVDRQVREARAAAQAEAAQAPEQNEWAKRLKQSLRESKGRKY